MLEFILQVILEVILVVVLKDSSFRDSRGPVTVLRVNVLTTDRECNVRVYLIVLWVCRERVSLHNKQINGFCF